MNDTTILQSNQSNDQMLFRLRWFTVLAFMSRQQLHRVKLEPASQRSYTVFFVCVCSLELGHYSLSWLPCELATPPLPLPSTRPGKPRFLSTRVQLLLIGVF